MKKQIIFWIIVLAILTISTVSAEDYEIYFSEFNNTGETCSLKDSFYYITHQNIISKSIVILCCKDDSCLEIPFDIKNLQEYQDDDLQEIFNVVYVRQLLREGKISPSIYSFGDNFNFCDFYGFDSLRKESFNLAGSLGDKAAHYLPTNAQKVVVTASKSGKALGLIKGFNPGVFITSVVCKGLIDQEKEAIQQIAICNNYMNNLAQGNAYYGIISDLETCNSEASSKLKAVKESALMQIKGAADTIGNAIGGLFDWARDPLNKEFEIKESTYDKLVSAYNKISKEDPDLTYSLSYSKSTQAKSRLSNKNIEASNIFNQLSINKNKVYNSKPSWFIIQFENMFMSPNHNYNTYKLEMNRANEKLNVIRYYIGVSRYNSAIELHNEIQESLGFAEKNVIDDKNILRNHDYFAIILALVIVLVLIFGFKKLKENHDYFY